VKRYIVNDADITEADDGDYVAYEDVEPLIEALRDAAASECIFYRYTKTDCRTICADNPCGTCSARKALSEV